MSISPHKNTKDFLIRNIPIELFERLERAAELHHRSKTQEAIVLLTNGLTDIPPIKKLKPFKWEKRVDSKFLRKAIDGGRS